MIFSINLLHHTKLLRDELNTFLHKYYMISTIYDSYLFYYRTLVDILSLIIVLDTLYELYIS